MIWVCILCRKKQELLIKTGTWMHSTAEMSSDPILRSYGSEKPAKKQNNASELNEDDILFNSLLLSEDIEE